MAELINMPKLGFDMQEGQLVKWLKKPGDSVQTGEIVAEIESDKATVEVEAYVAGTFLQLLVNEGDWVPIGAPIAVVGQLGEQYDLAALGVAIKETGVGAGATSAPTEAQAAPVATPSPPAEPAPAPTGEGDGRGLPGGVRASPLARRLAEEHGIDLARVSGSGPQGRIVREDVEEFKESAVAAPPAPAPRPVALTPIPAGPDSEEIPTPRMRSRIGARMTESKQTVPHFYVTTEVDMGPALALRSEINAKRDPENKVSVNDMIVKAAALALREFPNINSAFNGETIIRHNRINVGIAVAVENGLLNVVSRDADLTPLTVMAPVHRDMIARAREGKIKPEDVEGETFAVSNLGAYEVDHFIAIINPPAAAILAVGTARQTPVALEDGSLGVGWRMKATVSADHRVTDGAEAAQFLQRVKQILEDPLRLLM
jgi:pyruvate dehydrogenase E2 component (dihydrolipoamide acetyltransferase)